MQEARSHSKLHVCANKTNDTKMRRLGVTRRRQRRNITNMATGLDASTSDDDNDTGWQTTRPATTERIKYIFNNELLSDMKFVVPLFFIGNCIMNEVAAHQFCACN